ncbi:hypothetical protein LINPERHAP2_LOCUS25009 [Linum perenne]
MMSSFILAAQNLGSHHRSKADKERYIREFRTRPLFPTFKFFPEGFIKYGAPLIGLTVHNNDQLAAARFDVPAALRALNYAQKSTLPPLHIGRLLPHLRMIHFLITRHFLPRSFDLTTLSSIDIWILYHATITQLPHSLPHLMLQTLHDASLSSYAGHLPFASFITTLLLKVGVDLQFKVWDSTIYPLRAQSVLRKLNIPNAPQRPKPDITKGGAQGISYCCTD